MTDTRLVYSTDGGDFRKRPGTKSPPRSSPGRSSSPPADGIVRISREKGGRGGKEVTVIRGLPGDEEALRAIAGELKRACGVGGTVRDGTVEIQGDQRQRLVPLLEARGHRVRLAGG